MKLIKLSVKSKILREYKWTEKKKKNHSAIEGCLISEKISRVFS